MVHIERFIHGNCRWNEGKGNMSSEFGFVGVHEMELVWLINEILQIIIKVLQHFLLPFNLVTLQVLVYINIFKF
jgi:hypothetical protein